MTEPLNQRIATNEGRWAFDREVAGLLRGRLYAEVERVLSEALAARPGAIADACQATPLDAVSISGWPELHREIDQLGAPVTAIGLNLSNYNDAVGDAEWHDREPAIEVAYYTDDAYGFSSASLDALLAASEAPPTPWQGRMEPVEGPPPLALHGFRTLNSVLLVYGNDRPWRPGPRVGNSRPPAPDEAVAFAVGEWFLHLRFHQVVERDLAQHGLPRALPVLVGEHDVGPFVSAVLMSRAGARAPAPASAPRGPEPPVPEPSDNRRAAEAFLAEMRAARDAIKRCGLFAGAKRRALVADAEACEKAFLAAIGLAWRGASWESTDAQFEAFARAVRICCDLPETNLAPQTGSGRKH
jgi:hypothetical protein